MHGRGAMDRAHRHSRFHGVRRAVLCAPRLRAFCPVFGVQWSARPTFREAVQDKHRVCHSICSATAKSLPTPLTAPLGLWI